jgi:hypothetical protein
MLELLPIPENPAFIMGFFLILAATGYFALLPD